MADFWRSVQYQWLWHRRHKVDDHNHCHTKQQYFNLAYLNNLITWKLNETTKRNRYTYWHVLLLASCRYHNWSPLIITFSFSCRQLCMALSRQWLAQTPNRLQIHHRCDKETRPSGSPNIPTYCTWHGAQRRFAGTDHGRRNSRSAYIKHYGGPLTGSSETLRTCIHHL